MTRNGQLSHLILLHYCQSTCTESPPKRRLHDSSPRFSILRKKTDRKWPVVVLKEHTSAYIVIYFNLPYTEPVSLSLCMTPQHPPCLLFVCLRSESSPFPFLFFFRRAATHRSSVIMSASFNEYTDRFPTREFVALPCTQIYTVFIYKPRDELNRQLNIFSRFAEPTCFAV